MMIREPVVAGRFYPSDPDRCRAELLSLLDAADADNVAEVSSPLGEHRFGGLVPHAGWACSGAVAAKVFRSLAAQSAPSVVILFGGVHRYRGREAALFGQGRWQTPLGPIQIESRLAERILGHTNLIVEDPYAHEDEHSIEVQLPFVKHLFPNASVIPIMVPCVKSAPEIGDAVARTLRAYDYNALIVGTTDLTHYGPHYGFIPVGVGAEANAWAKNVNDRRFIDLVCRLRGDELVAEASAHKNACSSGAAAATIAAVTALGATEGVLSAHTSSSEVVAGRTMEEVSDSVGYAGIVFK
jgi:AmmeMemoRadiSam system protein B